MPIEFKFANNKKPAYSHILQLFGYGKLLSDNFDKDFKQAVIIYDKFAKRVYSVSLWEFSKI